MSLETTTPGTENRNKQCPLYGCKRVYTDPVALDSHIKDHDIPAESVPGKVLLCSSIGCSGSFPDMQKLMQHMRHHHKPNIFFLCESCRAKLRSYRGLLTHLHTCSKVSRSKLKTEPGFPLISSENWSNEQATPQQDDAADDHMQVSSHGQHVDNPLASPPHLDHSSTHLMDSQEPSSFQQVNQDPSQFPPQTQDYGASSFQSPHAEMLATDPLLFDGQAEHQGQSQAQGEFQAQHQSQAQPQPQSAPLSPTSSAAVWKKNQGQTGNSRILWEHTRGRYTCVQCNLSLPNRKAMTAHIHTEHKTPKEN